MHITEKKTGILLVNLGTPDSPHPKDVYRYLIEFLTDPRVIDKNWLARQLLVRAVIVPNRYKQSAESYQKIWTDQGSPLKVFGYRLRDLLRDRLGQQACVEFAMRYRSPSIEKGLESLIQQNCEKIIIFPLFPQYASATTGSVHQKIMEIVSSWQIIPELVFIDQFATDPGMIRAFCAAASLFDLQSYDHILFSFHGLPKSQLIKADRSKQCCMKSPDCCSTFTEKNKSCYSAQSYATARALVKELGLTKNQYSISFQSRLGKEPWLEPFTIDVIQELAKQGKKRLLVFCPAFVCDCLETIYEIGIEYAHEFKQAGGDVLDLVPGLNDHPLWIDALLDLLKEKI